MDGTAAGPAGTRPPGADAGPGPDGVLPPELAAVQASLLALIAAARATLDAVEAVVAEPRTFHAGAQLVQETVALAGPLVRAVAVSLLTPPAESGR